MPPTPSEALPPCPRLAPEAQPLPVGAFIGSSARFVCGFARPVGRFAPRAPARRSAPGAAPRGYTNWSGTRSGGCRRSWRASVGAPVAMAPTAAKSLVL